MKNTGPRRRLRWDDWMGRVAGLLMDRHGLLPGFIRPTDRWRELWRAGLSADQAAANLAGAPDRPAPRKT